MIEGDRGELGGPAEDAVGDDGDVLPALPQHQLPHCVHGADQPITGQAYS